MATRMDTAPRLERFQYGPWSITASTSHILSSEGPTRERYDRELELPNLPEMIFPHNVLRMHVKTGGVAGSGQGQAAEGQGPGAEVQGQGEESQDVPVTEREESGFGIEFNALDALKRVDATHDLVKVACADEWRESRSDIVLNNEHIKESPRPYDWTFSTDYCGTLIGQPPIKVEPTTEELDMELLRRREKILFYQDLLLFEDELSDNGTSLLRVKMRVMPSCLFILQRQYLRVDDVLVRVNDTRLFQQAGKDYMLREFLCKEAKMSELRQLPMSVIADSNEVLPHLHPVTRRLEKLSFPALATDTVSMATHNASMATNNASMATNTASIATSIDNKDSASEPMVTDSTSRSQNNSVNPQSQGS